MATDVSALIESKIAESKLLRIMKAAGVELPTDPDELDALHDKAASMRLVEQTENASGGRLTPADHRRFGCPVCERKDIATGDCSPGVPCEDHGGPDGMTLLEKDAWEES